MKKGEKKKGMNDAKAISIAVVSFFVLILILYIIGLFVSPSDDRISSAPQQTSKVQLTQDLINEICRDVGVYIEYCYDTDISADDCGVQMAEKLSRIYQLTGEQIQTVLEQC